MTVALPVSQDWREMKRVETPQILNTEAALRVA